MSSMLNSFINTTTSVTTDIPVKRLHLTLMLMYARYLVKLPIKKEENVNNDKRLCSMYSRSCIMPGNEITMVSVMSAS